MDAWGFTVSPPRRTIERLAFSSDRATMQTLANDCARGFPTGRTKRSWMDLPRRDGKGSRCGVGCWRGLACGIIQGADGGEERAVDAMSAGIGQVAVECWVFARGGVRAVSMLSDKACDIDAGSGYSIIAPDHTSIHTSNGIKTFAADHIERATVNIPFGAPEFPGSNPSRALRLPLLTVPKGAVRTPNSTDGGYPTFDLASTENMRSLSDVVGAMRCAGSGGLIKIALRILMRGILQIHYLGTAL
ncbi:hypothetical protein BJ912DRAFT_1048306 [Pholiota molesta]|nr:hypothetical protein BJ912DRAFT_1048306 [Pholiota molesta]